MSLSKKLTWKETLRQVFCLSEAQKHIPSPPHNVYLYTVYLFTHGRGRGDRGRVEQFTKLDRKYDKYLPQSPFTGQYF
jgi:hypothetical protein